MSITAAIRQRQEQEHRFEESPERRRARIVEVDGSVQVPNRPNWVWVQDASSSVAAAYNPRVADRPLPVVTRPATGGWTIVEDVDWEYIARSNLYDGDPYYKEHAISHEWRGNYPGPDAVSIYPMAWTELRTSPAGSGLAIDVAPLKYKYQGSRKYFAGVQDYDLSSYQPASGLARWVLVSLNKESNIIVITSGTAITDNDLYIPPAPEAPQGHISSAYVRLDGDQTAVSWTDIRNERYLLNAADPASADSLHDFPVSTDTPAAGDVLYYDGSGWIAATPLTEGGRWLADNGIMLIVDSA